MGLISFLSQMLHGVSWGCQALAFRNYVVAVQLFKTVIFFRCLHKICQNSANIKTTITFILPIPPLPWRNKNRKRLSLIKNKKRLSKSNKYLKQEYFVLKFWIFYLKSYQSGPWISEWMA